VGTLLTLPPPTLQSLHRSRQQRAAAIAAAEALAAAEEEQDEANINSITGGGRVGTLPRCVAVVKTKFDVVHSDQSDTPGSECKP
jgi:hypothetical protein